MASNTEKFASLKNLEQTNTSDLISTGPWIGVVKDNIDYTRNGRLAVYIPTLGNVDPEDPNAWVICQYLSPFMGFTNMNSPDTSKTYDAVQQSYGFWMVPPDIGVRVLVMFAEHDVGKAFWIGCIPEPLKNSMVPGIGSRSYAEPEVPAAGVVDFSPDYASDILIPAITESLGQWFTDNPSNFNDIRFPTSEVQFKDQEDPALSARVDNFYYSARAIHEDLMKQFLLQGIDRDKDRGPISSSAQRETPSTVFGFSTPGRLRKDMAQDAALIKKIKSGELTEEDAKPFVNKGDKARRGGHSLVMDDGDMVGQNNLIRLRTSRGHQITMHDTEEFIHIQHANGLAWVEIDARGQITIFSNNSLNVRTGLDLNLRADRNINIEAGDEVKIRGKNNIKMETDELYIKSFKNTRMHQGEDLTILTDGSLAINSTATSGWNVETGDLNMMTGGKIYLNTNPAPNSPEVEEIHKDKYNDVKNDGGYIWKETTEDKDKIETILEWIPTHEPYPRRIRPKTPEQIAEFYRNLN